MRVFRALSFQHKTILALLLLINLPFILTWFMAKDLTETTVLKEKESKLMALARLLDFRLSADGFEGILRQRAALGAPRDVQIKILNEALSPITDEIGASSSGLGVGYYSRALDAIVTYGPSSLFGHVVGKSIPADHPGHTVMNSGEAVTQTGSMVRGDILNSMLPIKRHGEVIGYTWANELKTDVTAQIQGMARDLLVLMGVCLLFACMLLFLFSRRTLRDVDRIIRRVREMRFDLSRRLEPGEGELGEVAASINFMAEGISRANEETERAVSVLQSVMSNVEAVIYVCDPANKKLVYANDYLRRIMNNDVLTGRLCHEVLQGRSEPCPFCPQKRLFDEEGRPVFTPVRWEFHNELAGRDFLVMDRLITWHDGRLLHMEVATDVTERKALALAEAANIAQREFLARMSHEIRTPMNGVLGMTRLAMQASPAPQQLEYLKKIQSSASLLLGIINDILDYSRIEAGKLSIEHAPFNPREMVDNIRELIFPAAREKNLDLSIKVDESVPERLMGDGLRLSQVLLNLLGNASKFTLSGYVRLRMRAKNLPSERVRLFCAVEDSGIGISPEQRKNLFKPFTQADTSTSRKFGGTGLGLSISKTLVKLMNGSISVESRPGQGSVFRFYVDLDRIEDGADKNEAAAKAQWADRHYEGQQILLVEDNAINQEIVLASLEQMGLKADVAENGVEAVQAFMRKEYSLILMDVRMPVMDGIEATRRIRASGRPRAGAVPIIAMTADVMEEDKKAGSEAGMNGRLDKPIDVDEFRRVLYEWLGDDRPQ